MKNHDKCGTRAVGSPSRSILPNNCPRQALSSVKKLENSVQVTSIPLFFILHHVPWSKWQGRTVLQGQWFLAPDQKPSECSIALASYPEPPATQGKVGLCFFSFEKISCK